MMKKILFIYLFGVITNISATPPCPPYPSPNDEKFVEQMDWIATGRISEIENNIKIYVNCSMQDRTQCATYDNAKFKIVVDKWLKPEISDKTLELVAGGWCIKEFPKNPNGVFTFYGMNNESNNSYNKYFLHYVQHSTDVKDVIKETTAIDEIKDTKRKRLYELITLFIVVAFLIISIKRLLIRPRESKNY